MRSRNHSKGKRRVGTWGEEEEEGKTDVGEEGKQYIQGLWKVGVTIS